MKKIFSLLLVLVAFVSINVSAEALTKEQLKSGFEAVMHGLNPSNQVTIDDEKITLIFAEEDDSSSAGETASIPYSIEEDNVKFTYTEHFSNGMDDADLFKLFWYDIISNICYSAVSYTKGNSIDDSNAYFNHYTEDNDSPYGIYYSSDEEDYAECDADQYCIRYDDFKSTPVRYLEQMIPEKEFTDNSTFTLKYNNNKIDDNNIEISSNLQVNTDADFTVVNGAAAKWGYADFDSDYFEIESESTQKSTTTENPQTGVNTYVMLIAVAIIALTSTVFFRKKVFRRL